MKILAIETSCDETSAAIIEAKKDDLKVKILANFTASSLSLHAKTGGIIPETAAREQIKYILPVIEKALNSIPRINNQNIEESIDAIAVTIGPGLIGSLLVGVKTAKTLSYVWNKPIIQVNHLIGHIYANFIRGNSKFETRNSKLNTKRSKPDTDIEFPATVLIVSGGHTDLLLMKNHEKIIWLGGTRDDAAGEAFDKIGRILNLPYPGGPNIEIAALKGNENAINFPRPLIKSDDFDFSFSGLKTAALREIQKRKLNVKDVEDISASVQKAIVDVLIKKTLKAAQKYNTKSILLAGGVAANQKLRDQFESEIRNLKLEIPLFVPQKWLCTDNAAMIGAAAFFTGKKTPWRKIATNPELYFN
ncbi:MAG: tRNA (adenosine(37)-N6)-threonylcarbamoyltransferase complex transferase subunit TsaD [Candidatus Levybacteria bacterium CG_4_9_14_3_um_filter_35_16]|nr:MAG: tRNA (adenosine(37)-N6)-threonylcarbamoyltransferase complex transferase subunit TsaD [Candidatus Levybacteria bacterium CG22_combo_CG10-13_8_21_14_all_35_11]PJA91103.1 MAG: tRNA (adenosine(37)-N6)-threonylcarbamoyltransferase complex transferase subunit TsaD [Candidatus Levybacteria bacterium CG_4_9_14_3_um_filter_35_16]PJC54458.1 MAG: tRNA (adenosine(37)-N6)-threonylcarbamoyltransferase complex transferase subunit TsaD [Candidatus Levybacteria bacterium CG_4_9_14_0_2_um_filter_35_21]